MWPTSCKSLATKENDDLLNDVLNKIVIPAPPAAKDENGNPYIVYDPQTNKYIVDEIYIYNLINYQFDVEAAAQALEALK